MKFLLLLLFFTQFFYGVSQNYRGKVLDIETNESLPFVNIILLEATEGTSSDINGEFSFFTSTPNPKFIFSYVGYKKDTLSLSKNSLNIIKLTPENTLKELVVDGSYNPAIPVIQKAIKNRKINNPELNHNFSYMTYNKMYVYGNTDDVDTSDSTTLEAIDFFEKQYLLLLETVEKNYHKKPGKNSSKIVASRTSGLSTSIVPMMATELQSFSFYPSFIKIGDNYFISPISNEGFSIYEYELMEKYVDKLTDTIFSIQFTPKRSTSDNTLFGIISISSSGYAIKSVSATPKIMDEFMEMTIHQLYAKIDSVWMPYQLNTSFLLKNIVANGLTFSGKSFAYIDSVHFVNDPPADWFSSFDVEVDAAALEKSQLDSLRSRPLSSKDSLTYKVIDSIGEAEKLDKKLGSMDSWLKGRIPIGVLDLDFSKGLNYNEYEGLRLGAGVYTNSKLMKKMSFGGYFAYGFKDKKWKYGGETVFKFWPKKNGKFKLSYQNDIHITASTQVGENSSFVNPDQYYRLYTYKYNGGEQINAKMSFLLKDFQIAFTGEVKQFQTKYDYGFVLQQNSSTVVYSNSYYDQNIGASIKYQPRSKLMFDGKKVINMGSKWPVFAIDYQKSINTSSFLYSRILGKVTGNFRIPRFAKSNFTIHTGWTNPDLPLPYLFYQKSTAKNLGISAFESFETAPIYSLISNRFISGFVDLNFGRLLSKGMLQPEFVLYNGVGWSNKINTFNHYNLNATSFESGYYETGVKLLNMLKSGFSGIGVGGFYHYGPYAKRAFKDNFVAKVTLNIGL